MDIYQTRALELEIEQLRRFRESPQQNNFWDDFEIGQAHEIARYRRASRTYRVNYH